MLKKTITYKDFNDVEHTEDFYFNLTKAELIEMAVNLGGDPTNWVNSIQAAVRAGDAQVIMKVFKDLVAMAIGVKSEDGKHFRKSSEITAEFLSSAAYDQMFMELMSDESAATTFITSMIPRELAESPKMQAAMTTVQIPASEEKLPWADREPTEKELASMTRPQLMDVYARRLGKQ
jgi:hypothetical protein